MLKTVVVALDESELSEQVFKTLQSLHLRSSATVVLAHVLPVEVNESNQVVDQPHLTLAEGVEHPIEQRLRAYQSQLKCTSQIEVVLGDPATEIIRLAKLYQTDLIVLGSRGLTGVTRILKGSVSSQVVEEAPCSVLVVKPQ